MLHAEQQCQHDEHGGFRQALRIVLGLLMRSGGFAELEQHRLRRARARRALSTGAIHVEPEPAEDNSPC
jgi:hypothetical protein